MRSNTRGFTIIEVFFVLAIAGLISLIVFEAIPALIRSSRNNQRKQDVSTILRAVSQYELKNSGNFPADCDGGSTCTTQLGTSNDNFLQSAKNDLTYYVDNNGGGNDSGSHVILKHLSAGAAAPTDPVTDPEVVYIYNYQICSTTVIGQSNARGGYSDVVALYALETGSGPATSQCQQL